MVVDKRVEAAVAILREAVPDSMVVLFRFARARAGLS
jgi:hypothetical protein